MKVLIKVLVIILLLFPYKIPCVLGAVETVTLVKSINDETFIIERESGELWLLEAKTFCFWTWLKEGSQILAIFNYLTTKLINPDNGEICDCWTEEQLN